MSTGTTGRWSRSWSAAGKIASYEWTFIDGKRARLEYRGIAVETLNSFYCKTTAELGQITEEQVLELALRTVTPHSTSLFVACSQLPTLNAMSKLRARLDIPVWSSIQATAWAGAGALTAQGLPVQFNQAA